MNTNNQNIMIDGVNPSMLWYNIADYIGNLSTYMVKTYKQRLRSNKPITWGELDKVNQDLHNQLDIIISGDRNVKTISENKEMNKKQVIRLTESQFHQIVKETVKRVLDESNFKDSSKMKYGNGFIQVNVDRNEGIASWIYMGNDGEPYSYGSMDIEEYVDNTWLPYEETHRPSRWIPKRIEGPVLKLFTKTGMRDKEY